MGRTANGIIFGVGAPNQCKDGSKTMCAIVLTEELGFIRIYPIRADIVFPVWSRVELEIERNEKDSRHESYSLLTHTLSKKVDDPDLKRDILNSSILHSGDLDPIAFQNNSRSSIALIRLPWEGRNTTMASNLPEHLLKDEECSWILTQKEFWQIPYLGWKSDQGARHTTHLVGREVYEGLRKNPERPHRIWENMQITNPDYDAWLLLGNMRNRRNVWVGVHVHRLKKNADRSTDASCNQRNGNGEGWPYCKQHKTNVSIVEQQLQLFITGDTDRMRCPGNT